MKSWLDRTLSLVLTVSLASMAAVLVHRELVADHNEGVTKVPDPGPPELHTGWRELLDVGVLMGDVDAPIKIVEFADLQCPYCRQYHSILKNIRRRFGEKVATVFVHFPLSYHPSARPAARALECARSHDAFERFLDSVFEKQDSLGAKSWVSYATDAGIADTATFSK